MPSTLGCLPVSARTRRRGGTHLEQFREFSVGSCAGK
jgi:hypothetical protein